VLPNDCWGQWYIFQFSDVVASLASIPGGI
jgi:hypothetical protein